MPVDVIAHSLGLRIAMAPGGDDLSGFLLRDTATEQNVIGVNRAQSSKRKRFTIAHEMGHFLLHDGEPLHVDALSSYRIDRRSDQSSKGDDPKEIEANAFAAELLMPEQFVRRELVRDGKRIELSDDDTIDDLARVFEVSTTAMSFRLANLGLISLQPPRSEST